MNPMETGAPTFAEEEPIGVLSPAPRTVQDTKPPVGGWLSWLATCMVVTLGALVRNLWQHLPFLFQHWAGMSRRLHTPSVQYLIAENASSLIAAIALVALLILMWRQSHLFPPAMLAFFGISAIWTTLKLIYFDTMASEESVVKAQIGFTAWGRHVAAGVVAAIWISYLLTSKRVRSTFGK